MPKAFSKHYALASVNFRHANLNNIEEVGKVTDPESYFIAHDWDPWKNKSTSVNPQAILLVKIGLAQHKADPAKAYLKWMDLITSEKLAVDCSCLIT